MSKIDKALQRLFNNPDNSSYADLVKVCDEYFGQATLNGGSHRVYRTGSPENPRLVIQSRGTRAKGYQVRQVLLAVQRVTNGERND